MLFRMLTVLFASLTTAFVVASGQARQTHQPLFRGQSHEELLSGMGKKPDRSFIPPTFCSSTPFPIIKVNQDTGAAPQNESSVRINPKNPDNIVAVFRDFRLSWNPPVRNVTLAATTDGGKTWHETFAAYADHNRFSDPSAGVDTAGNFYVSTLDWDSASGGLLTTVRKSTDGGLSWLPAVPVGSDAFIYDKDMMNVDDSRTSPFCNNIYVAWNTWNWMEQFARSTDFGASFSAPADTPRFYMPAPATGPNGELYVADFGDSSGMTRVEIIKSIDGGQTFGEPSFVSDPGDPPVVFYSIDGTINSLAEPVVAVDKSTSPRRGTVYVVWLDQATNLVCSRSDNGGKIWNARVPINNNTTGGDRFHFWMTVDDSGFVDVVFLDRRNDPNRILCDAYFAQSRDGGRAFKNFKLTPQNFDPRIYPNADVRLGEYIGIDARQSRIVPCWVDTHLGNQDIFIAIIDQQRTASIEGTIAASSPEGYAGWDVMISHDNGTDHVTTDSAGRFLFTGLFPGTYQVSEDTSPCLTEGCWRQSYPDSPRVYTITIDSTEAVAGIDFHNSFVTSVGEGVAGTAFELRQNFPNPFNPVTTIRYTLPGNGKVLLRIYNVLGQEIRRLVDGFQVAGDKQVTFDAGDLPSGVYFYRLQVGSGAGGSLRWFNEVKKMLLAR